MSKRMIKVAAAQILTDLDVTANAKKVESAVRQAARQGCEIILFHEGCLTGYPSGDQVRRIDLESVAKAERRICRLAGRLGIAVLLGSVSSSNGKLYNDVMIASETGRCLGRYAKTWRAGEPWYAAGSGPVVFKVAGVWCTVIICHDLRYPELVRLAVAAGARIVFIANNESGIEHENKLSGYRAMQIARGTENYVFSVMCNAPADPADISRCGCSHGNSMIVDPLGNVLDEAGVFEQRLVTARLDLSQATRKTVLRTLCKMTESERLYGTACENPAYAAWMSEGVKLVRRL